MKHNIFHVSNPFLRRMMHLISVIILAASAAGCSSAALRASQPSELEALTIGMDNTAVNTLILIALEQGYFTANGLKVTVKGFPSGLAAVNDMLAGKGVDVATSSEFVLVGKALAGEKIRAWGSIDKFMHNYLIARKDHGVAQVTDLRGKKVGVPLKTVAEFYLGRFLELHNVNLDDVTLVDVAPTDMIDALTSGKVDAVTVWQPNALKIEAQMGSGIVKWSDQSEQATYAVVVSTPAWMESHPQAPMNFLKALARAEAWYASHPGETKALLKKQLGYDDAFVAAIWEEHQFQLSLDQSLILAMEDESRWMIRHQLTSAAETPFFLNYLSPDPIQAVKPESVNIIR